MSFDKYFKHGSSESFDVRAASPQQAATNAVQPSSYDKYFEKNTAKPTPTTSVAVKKPPQKEKQTFWEKAAEKTKEWFTSPEDNTGHQIIRNPYTGMSMRIGFSPEVQKKYDDIVSEIDYLESVKGYATTVEQADEIQAQIKALSEEASSMRQSVGLEDKAFTSSERLEAWGSAWRNQFGSAYAGAAGNVSEMYANRYDVGTDEETYNALSPDQQAEYDRLMAQREQLEQSRAYVTTTEQSDELEAAFRANSEALQAIAPTDQSKAEALYSKSDELNREYQKDWNKAAYGQSDAEIFLMQAGHQGLNIAADSLATIATIPLGGWGGKVSMAGRIYGQTASEARRQGDDVYTAAQKGLTSAAIETLSEMIGGGFDKVYGKSLISGAVEKFVGNPIVKGAIDALGEGAEEGLASVMQLAADHMFGWSKSGNTFLEDIKANSGDMVYEMLLGTFVGVFGASGQIAIDSAREADAIAAFAKVYGSSAEDIIQQGLDSKAGSKAYRMALNNQEKLAQNGKISDADLYKQFKANVEQIKAEGGDEEVWTPESAEPSAEAANAYFQQVRLKDAAEKAAWDEVRAKDTAKAPDVPNTEQPETPKAESPKVETPEAPKQEAPKAVTPKPTKSKALHESYADMESDNSSIESYAAKYEGRAGDVQQAYTEGQDVAEFGKAFDAAYRIGESMLPERSLGKIQNLSDEQKQIAFQMGRDAAKERATARVQNIFGKGTGGRGVVSGEGITLADVRKKFNEAQNTAYRVLDKFARATGVNIVLYSSDESGSREEGSFSWKDNTIRININSGVFSSGDVKDLSKYTALRTFSHELTHFTEKWNAEQYDSLREFVFEALDEKGVDVDERIQLRMAAGLSYDMASREVVADSMADMLGQSDIFERLAKKDANMAQSLLNKLKEFVARLKQAFKSMTTQNNYEAEILKDTIGYSEELVKKWTDVLEGGIEAYNGQAALNEVGVSVDTDTDSAHPVQHSLATWNESEYVQHRDDAAQALKKALGVSIAKAKSYIDSINAVAKLIADDKTRLDYQSAPGLSSFVSNSEYGGSFDFSTLCKKRRLLTGTFTAIQKALPNTALSAEDILDIRRRMSEKGLEVNCGLCYVEGSRAEMGKFAKQFIELYKKYNPGKWYPNMAQVNTPDGIEWVRINHPEVFEQYEYFWNHYGTLKKGDPNLFASQQKPKLYQSRTEYKGEITKLFKGDSKVAAKNLNGGIRFQSFSDFEIVHLIDMMQIVMDMSKVGLAGQAYTKVPDFAWAMGNTGIKINLSLIAKDVDANGRLIFDDVEGMPVKDAMRLRNTYSDNVGTIVVAFNDEQIKAAMADERIDFIIPFHRSQWKKDQYSAMGLPANTTDYTNQQNEKFIKPQFHEYKGKQVQDKASNYMPNEYWDFSKSGKENAEAYLQMCAENNKRPKFYKFLQDNGDGSYSLKSDGSTDGYWKMLIDFKMYNNEGIGVPQQPVRPEFNMDEAQRMLNEYEGGHERFPVAQGVVDEFLADYNSRTDEDIVQSGIKEIVGESGEKLTQRNDVEQNARGTATLSDRDLLEAAAARLPRDKLTESEKLALVDFQKKLDKLKELQEQRAEQGHIYKEQMFTKGGNRAEAQKTKNRMDILDKKINSLENTILSMKDRDVFKKILKSAREMIEREARASEQKTLAEYRAKRNESEGQKKYRDRIIKTARELMAWISTPSAKEGKRVPLELQEALSGLLSSIDFTSKRALKGGDATKRDIDFKKRLQAVKDALDRNIEAVGAESGYVDIRPEFSEEYDALVAKVDSLIGEGEDYVINRMSAEELKQLSELLGEVKHYVQNANVMHENEVFKTAHEAGDESIQSMGKLGKASKGTGLAGRFFNWFYMRPAYVFSRFGKGGESIYQEFRKAQGVQARLSKEVLEFSEKTFTPEMAQRWAETTRTFNIGGEKVKIPISHIMSMYCLSKREQGLLHLLGGGFRVSNFKNGKETVTDVGHKITREKLDEILATLDQFPAAKKVADELQNYMSTVCAAWGNEVDMVRFGVPKFLEKYYFPINSDGRQLAATTDEAPMEVSLYALLNAGFTKNVQIGANNRLIVYNIFDVFANHTTSMVQYRSFALPVLDTLKWFNHKNEQGVTVRDAMAKAFGSKGDEKGSGSKSYAEDFVINLLRDYNGARRGNSSGVENALLKGLSNINRVRVSFNLSTMLLQPTAIARAGMFLKGSKIIRGLGMAAKDYKGLAAEMEKHSGIALWKSLGFYDVNISRGMAEQIKQDKDWKQKFNDMGMKGAEAADRFTWTAIWAASKMSVNRAKYKTEAEYFEAVTDVFEEIIYKTQVVDSVLTKAEAQREKGFAAKSVMSFMSEAVASTSLLSNAAMQYDLDSRQMGKAKAWQKNRKHIGRAIKVWTVSKVLSAAVSALVAAWRDDDDYEDNEEKYFSALKEKLLDELNPLGDLPVVGDVISILQGYSDSSELGQIVNYFTSAYGIIMDKLDKDDDGDYEKYTWWGAMYKVLQGASAILGAPFATMSREAVDLWNNTAGRLKPEWKLHTYDPGVQNSIKYAYQDGYISEEEAQQLLIEEGAIEEEDGEKAKNDAYWIVQGWQGIGKYDELREAVINRDSTTFKAVFEHLIEHGVFESTVYSQVTSLVGDSYSEGTMDRVDAAEVLIDFAGKTVAEAEEYLAKKDFQLYWGQSYDSMKYMYQEGKMSAEDVIYWRTYVGSSENSAEQWMLNQDIYMLTGYESESTGSSTYYDSYAQKEKMGTNSFWLNYGHMFRNPRDFGDLFNELDDSNEVDYPDLEYYDKYEGKMKTVSKTQRGIIYTLNDYIRRGIITPELAKIIWTTRYGYSASKKYAFQFVIQD